MTEQKHDEPLSERIIIPVTPSMLEAVKDYWHTHRLDSRADAVRQLIQTGLDAGKAKGRK